MRHALEPDHLAAVSTLVSQERDSYRGALLGLFWGLGHTLTLVLVAATLLAARAAMPPAAADMFEFFVAVMLVGLGLQAIRQGGSPGPGRSGSPASPRPDGPPPSRRERTRPHRHVDAGAPPAPRRRGSRPRRKRRVDGARPDDVAVDGRAAGVRRAVRRWARRSAWRPSPGCLAGRWLASADTRASCGRSRCSSAVSRRGSDSRGGIRPLLGCSGERSKHGISVLCGLPGPAVRPVGANASRT